jgi:NTP pyrophosphatase (non-canonical NTP hydrolase)
LTQGVIILQADLHKYTEFVEKVTSDASNNLEVLIARLRELDAMPNLNIALLDTAGQGLASEGGEFNEIIKKMKFQGKPFNEDIRFHLKRELGDIFWYWTNACRALGLDPNDVIAENVDKLVARYPGGVFDVSFSENRQAGDL